MLRVIITGSSIPVVPGMLMMMGRYRLFDFTGNRLVNYVFCCYSHVLVSVVVRLIGLFLTLLLFIS
jgi:hypothetical protein